MSAKKNAMHVTVKKLTLLFLMAMADSVGTLKTKRRHGHLKYLRQVSDGVARLFWQTNSFYCLNYLHLSLVSDQLFERVTYTI